LCIQSKYVAAILASFGALFLIGALLLSSRDNIEFSDDNPIQADSWYAKHVASNTQIVHFLIFGAPTLDTITNLWYLFGENFYSPVLFALSVVTMSHGLIIFIAKLKFLNALPFGPYLLLVDFTFLGVTSSEEQAMRKVIIGNHEVVPMITSKFPLPKWGEGHFPLFVPFFCNSQRNPLVVVWVLICWVSAVVTQVLIWVIVFSLWPVFLSLWFLIGIILQMTKVLAIGRVWNVWFTMWTASDKYSLPYFDTGRTRSRLVAIPQGVDDVDTEDFNWVTVIHVFSESIPMLILQIVNSYLLNQFNAVAAISISLSGFNVLYIAWGIPYRKYFETRATVYSEYSSLPMAAVPVSMLNMQIPPTYKEDDLLNMWSRFKF